LNIKVESEFENSERDDEYPNESKVLTFLKEKVSKWRVRSGKFMA
jgi:hypothetical protein